MEEDNFLKDRIIRLLLSLYIFGLKTLMSNDNDDDNNNNLEKNRGKMYILNLV